MAELLLDLPLALAQAPFEQQPRGLLDLGDRVLDRQIARQQLPRQAPGLALGGEVGLLPHRVRQLPRLRIPEVRRADAVAHPLAGLGVPEQQRERLVLEVGLAPAPLAHRALYRRIAGLAGALER